MLDKVYFVYLNFCYCFHQKISIRIKKEFHNFRLLACRPKMNLSLWAMCRAILKQSQATSWMENWHPPLSRKPDQYSRYLIYNLFYNNIDYM